MPGEVEPNEDVKEGVKSSVKSSVMSKLFVAVVFLLLVAFSYRYFSSDPAPVQMYGVNVFSDKPVDEYISEIQNNGILLLDSKLPGGLTCNFELSAGVPRGIKGYKVSIDEGEQGVYFYKGLGSVKGMTEREIVSACNVFTCIVNNISCPGNVLDLSKVFSGTEEINIVLDYDGRQNAGRAYAELLGVAGFLQAEKVDVNKDSILSDFEINNVSGNFIAIRPYLMYTGNNTCQPQPLHNLVESFEPESNLSVECSRLYKSIFVLNSSVNKIVIENSNIYLFGDEAHIYAESVLVRDAISPRWIRVLYQLDK